MKRIFIVACMLTFALMVSAQGGQGGGQRQMTPEQRAEFQARQLERYKTELKLTDKQVADFKKINDEYTPKQQALFEKYRGGDMDKFREESTKLRTEQNGKVKKILSAEQYKKYEEMLEAQRQRMQGGGNR